jgi:hypothetical protein
VNVRRGVCLVRRLMRRITQSQDML